MLLVDHSGSVKPYYESGLFASLTDDVKASAGENNPVRLYAFDIEPRPIPSMPSLNGTPYGGYTFLDRAVQAAIDQHFQIAWVITDNIQDNPSDAEAGNTAAFYRILRGDDVKRVVVFPLLQDPGRSGIAVYGILLAEPGEGDFESQVRAFLARARTHLRTEALRMKPLNRDTVEVAIEGLSAGEQPKIHDEGEAITVKLEIRFRSKLEHLKIVDSHIEPAHVKPEFAPDSLLQAEKQELDISPDRVVALDPQGETAQVYTVNVNLGKISLRKDLKSLFKAAWGGKSIETISLHIPLTIQVPQTNFHFRDSFVQEYHAPSLEAAKLTGKIYAIETLPELLSDAQTLIRTDLPVSFRVKYPLYPAIVTLLLIGAAGGLLGALIWLAIRLVGGLQPRKKWTVTAASEYGRSLPCLLREDGELFVDEDPGGQVRGATYTPPDGGSIVAGEGKLVSGATVGVKLKRGTIVLKFQEASKAQALEQKPFEPRRID
jgi:hypothetical protein